MKNFRRILQGVLRLQVNRARGLPIAEPKKEIDPYCVIQVGANRYKTDIIKHTTQPIWNEVFEVGVLFT